MAHDRRFRFGVHTSDAAPGTAWVDAAKRIESLGFSTLFLAITSTPSSARSRR